MARSFRENRSVILLTGNHLCHNPRVQKEAAALARADYDVEVLGAWIDPALAAKDRELLYNADFRFTPVLDGGGTNIASRAAWQTARARAKGARGLHGALGIESRAQLGTVYPALRRAASRRSAALFIAHSEPALAVAPELRRRGCAVGVDMEDWFSEDLLPEARHNRPLRLLRRLERDLLGNGAIGFCPSRAMSGALSATYSVPPPAVVYNAFPWRERESLDGLSEDRPSRAVPSIHWFSQTIGVGRGLEDLFAALPLLAHPAEIHLRGRPVAGFSRWLEERVPPEWGARIHLHDIVAPGALLSRIAEHDIGFAGEMKYCRSRDLTVTNKILQYLLGGLAVVASDTEGQREIAAQAPEAVLVYPSGDPAALAARLNELLGWPEWLGRAKAAALAVAKSTFCWERQEPVLLDVVAGALPKAGVAEQLPLSTTLLTGAGD